MVKASGCLSRRTHPRGGRFSFALDRLIGTGEQTDVAFGKQQHRAGPSSMHVRASQPRHSLSKLNQAGAEQLVVNADLGSASVAGYVRMVAKISEWPALSGAAVATNDFYRDTIQCIRSHLPSHSSDSSHPIVASAAMVHAAAAPALPLFLWKAQS